MFAFFTVLLIGWASLCAAEKGIVELDSWTFDKIVDGSVVSQEACTFENEELNGVPLCGFEDVLLGPVGMGRARPTFKCFLAGRLLAEWVALVTHRKI